MSIRSTTSRRHVAAVLLPLLLSIAGCGDTTGTAPGPRFTIQPPVASMVVGQQRDVGVAWEGEIPADAQASWVASPDTIVRLVAASTWGATLQARQVGTTLVTLTITSQGRAASRDMVVTVDPLVCLPIGPVVTPSTTTITVGARVQLAVSMVPPPPCGPADGSVTFTSSATAVAVVDSAGWVTGVSPGIATVTVRPRGNFGLSGSAQVTVRQP
jgi:trimeric autotransporter adhesin